MKKIILASKSTARKNMLQKAGVKFKVKKSDINERKLQLTAKCQGCKLNGIALFLANHKAIAVSRLNPEDYVIGVDQTLIFENQLYNKAENPEKAKELLWKLRGKTHSLIVGCAIARQGEVIWQCQDEAEMQMRMFDERFLQNYVEKAKTLLCQSVGGYAIESIGIQLFDNIKGDYFSILGLPLLPVLQFLRQKEMLFCKDNTVFENDEHH